MVTSNGQITYLFFCFIILTGGCDIINPDEPTPAYIHVPTMELKTDYSTEGTSSHNITDVWIYLQNDPIGIYELPATIPVLKTGEQNLQLQAGIKQNGISDTRVRYPFFKVHDTSFQLKKLKTDTLRPTLHYRSTDHINFAWMEDFESSNSIERVGQSARVERRSSNQVRDYLKNWVGKVTLNSSTPKFDGHSIEEFSNPDNNREVYLELNYKCTAEFNIGIRGKRLGQTQSQFKVTVNKQPKWNKIYIDFTKEVSEYTGNFEILFSAKKPDSISSAEIYWDNIKLIHFKE